MIQISSSAFLKGSRNRERLFMEFFVLNPRPKGKHECARTDFLQEEGFNVGEAPECQLCGTTTGKLSWLPPYRVELETWGKVFGDFAFFGAAGDFLVSERFKQIYGQEELSGLSEFAPVEIVKVKRYRKPAGNLPRYFKANVVRSGTAVDLAASGYEWSEKPDICPKCLLPKNDCVFKRRKGIIVRPETWEGDDIFIARGASAFITNGRFREVCLANDVRNAVFIPAEEYGHDFYPWDPTGFPYHD